jgi:hypothetical protein
VNLLATKTSKNRKVRISKQSEPNIGKLPDRANPALPEIPEIPANAKTMNSILSYPRPSAFIGGQIAFFSLLERNRPRWV